MDKFEELFASYTPALEGEELKGTIQKILDAELAGNDTLEIKKFLHGTIDLTTLMGADTETKVAGMVQSLVNDFDAEDVPHVAAICVYPNFVSTVKETLQEEGVRVACVSGAFPSSQSFLEVKIAETAMAVQAGADEIDIVLNLGRFLEEDYEEARLEIEEQRAACKQAHLKVILETGALPSSEAIRRASLISLYAGADFLKTSTGKEYPGASLEAAYVMCQVLKEYHQKYGQKRGIKFSGGIKTSQDALKYYTLVKHILGEEWLTPELFRIGASSLVASLQQEVL